MNNKIPKSITKKPSSLAVVLSIISIVVWVPHTLPFGGVQTIYAIGLLPIGIASFFFSYYSGLTIAKLSYGIAKKHYMFWAYFWQIVINVVCIIICTILEITLAGNPIKICFDVCGEIKISTAITCYSIFATIILLPGYFVIPRYFKYVKKYHLPKPS